MSKKMTTRKDIIRFIEVSGNYWELEGCDICFPIPIEDLEEFIKCWDSKMKEPSPWLCDSHARELDLLW